MKEKLLERAMELAKECRSHYDSLQGLLKEKDAKSIREIENSLASFIQHAWHLVGFCEALVGVDVFSLEDLKKIWNSIFPEEDFYSKEQDGLSKEILDFIENLKGLDNLGPKN